MKTLAIIVWSSLPLTVPRQGVMSDCRKQNGLIFLKRTDHSLGLPLVTMLVVVTNSDFTNLEVAITSKLLRRTCA